MSLVNQTHAVTSFGFAQKPLSLVQRDGLAEGVFQAMACPCQILLDHASFIQSAHILDHIATEVWRIEQKYSRYQPDSMISRINQSQGQPVDIDAETYRLLMFAETLYTLSDGLFDVTSGVLRKVWTFDGSDRIPSQAQIDEILPFVGWDKVTLTPDTITVPKGMQLDLGGIGKEYAVDHSYHYIEQQFEGAFLVNFGGDLRAKAPRQNGTLWQVGIENPDDLDTHTTLIELGSSAIATSGDSKRFLMKDGKRYGHLLDPTTGWSVVGNPRAVTVQANTCTQAGMLSSLAQLQGQYADAFLAEQTDILYWIS